ncbi:hypothetical protein FACS189421_07050 [Bacteroidia bacterium]|nr:hypothetical protein FACS189421_07050 [Bacteroidia bacterium]
MNKLISFAAIAAILAISAPAFALENESLADSAPAAVVEEIATEPTIEKSVKVEYVDSQSNPKANFPNGLQFGFGVSATSGVGGFIGYANKDFDSFWWKRLGFRVDFATSAPMKSSINSGLNSAIGDGLELGGDNAGLTIDNLGMSMQHFGAVVDFYPFGDTWFLGGWRLSGGYVSGKTSLGAGLTGRSAALSGPLEFSLDGADYRYNGGDVSGRADLKWKYSGPYLGTGFDLGLFAGVKIYTDFGVVFTSRAAQMSLNVPVTDKLQVSNDGGSTWDNVQGNGVLQGQFDNAKTAALRDANDDLNKIKIYPMVKLGFMYRF